MSGDGWLHGPESVLLLTTVKEWKSLGERRGGKRHCLGLPARSPVSAASERGSEGGDQRGSEQREEISRRQRGRCQRVGLTSDSKCARQQVE